MEMIIPGSWLEKRHADYVWTGENACVESRVGIQSNPLAM